MSAELYITFENNNWLYENKKLLEKYISEMKISVEIMENEYRFKQINNQYYDVRFIIINNYTILFEITYNPKIIEEEFKKLFSWLRGKTNIVIKDEDGELSNW